MATPSSTPYLDALQRDGYVHIPSLLTSSELTTLRSAAGHITSLARSGKWPHIRTVPKQFPPWPLTPPPAAEGGIWGVQHLLHPEMPGREAFARLYFSDRVLGIVEELVGVKKTNNNNANEDQDQKEPLTMELLNLLVSPSGNVPFALRWHRDDIPTPPSLTPAQELQQLQQKSPSHRPQSHAQYNIALYPDASLIVVPGSHRRARTQVERDADAYEDELPGQKVVRMEAGDAVFYDSNIWHRGVYRGVESGSASGEMGYIDALRMTVHGSVGVAEGDDDDGGKGGEGDKDKEGVRAKVVLQHGVGFWVKRDDAVFDSAVFGPRAEAMRKRLVEMGSGEGVGYALDG
ncbi:hypothetical protein AJ80_02712 [Polytolypa hystricis UAMH7299]|uniref:Phytanoyl-CoA dioxygenase n=1 Tax=Polytolypa hystricis (strain UAMH7299) TaxID=1447883 RepID=A0A2B7YQP6_POLH7|nr:hypothetical protein AJ80_02712 [Polytolypa hystricis UAMH7299]